MKQKLLTRSATRKLTPDEILKAGDYYIVEGLASADEKQKPHRAIVIKCPFCRMDMASTGAHTVIENHSRFKKITLFGFPLFHTTVTVKPMLQCPYNTSHKFFIKRDRIKAL